MKNCPPQAAGLLAASIFGFSFVFSKMALEYALPIQLIGFRFLAAFMLLSILSVFGWVKISLRGKNLKPLFWVALFQPVLYFIFETYSLLYAPVSEIGLMLALIPAFVVLLSAVFLKERPNMLQYVFIILSIAGAAMINLINYNGFSLGRGTLLLLLADLSAACYYIFSRKAALNFSSMEITYVMMGFGAVIFNVLSVLQLVSTGSLGEFFDPLCHKEFMIGLAYLGILSSVGAFFLMNYNLSKLKTFEVSVLVSLETVISIVTGVWFFGDPFYWYHFVGTLLILLGAFGTNYFTSSVTNEAKSDYKA